MSKARVLQFLRRHASTFVIDPFVSFSAHDWFTDPESVLDMVASQDLGPIVIVRSSAAQEDVGPQFLPGTFHSQSCVRVDCREDLVRAVDIVIESYRRKRPLVSPGKHDEIIVQRQLVNSRLSGVMTSRDLASNDPYYLVEYDDSSGRTDSVTSGQRCARLYLARHVASPPAPWDKLLAAARRIEMLLDNTNLVIEFALDGEGQIHIFQARQRPTAEKVTHEAERVEMLEEACASVRSKPEIVWSDMTDWNPVEMLGERARPLDISLYRLLVTDGTWASARASLGYYDVRPAPLVETIGCKAYVNTKLAFESLTPALLTPKLRQRLVADRLDVLREYPELHDKVELKILFTCADVAVPSRTRALLARGFRLDDIELLDEALASLTSSLFLAGNQLWMHDRARLSEMESRHRRNPLVVTSQLGLAEATQSVLRALDSCRDLGVFSFARLARLAFIARDLLERMTVACEYDRDWPERILRKRMGSW